MELIINKLEDLEKLKGWTIKEASFSLAAGGVDPVISFKLEHPAAECPVLFAVKAFPTFGRSGNIALVNASFNLHTEDVR